MIKHKLQEDDIVLCVVKRIEGTTVFLEIEDNGEGSMTFSEVSPGRIRNIRQFVVPNKKVVCKVLMIKDGHPQLSLRRVTAKEREEVMERYKKANVLANILKTVLKEKATETLSKIKEKHDPADFLDEAREDPKIIEKFVTKKQAEELAKILKEKREKEKQVTKKISLTSTSPSGLIDIKETLKVDNAQVHYLGSSKFSITIKAPNFKTANLDMEKAMEEIKARAKKHQVNVETK